ncbi:MAG TPA: autotransporter-associated beta strand repeat-containing protein, partial [Thermoanaerobaculia bacterium]|nr:autotransporter-associated beta strand repeat-containing protein [Thermoanaerobaculia bacterium]
ASLVLAGTLVTSGNLTFDGFGDTTLMGAGVLGGTGNLVKNGDGTLTITGSSPFSGSTLVANGTLSIQANGALGTGPGPVTIANNASLFVQGGLVVPQSLVLQGPGDGETGALHAISGSNSFTGGITLPAFASLAVDSGGVLTFQGTVSGPGGLGKDGAGQLVLNGMNSYGGMTIVNAGTLTVNGSQPQSNVTVEATGTLGGTGTVGALASMGQVSPGQSPGILSPGILTLTAGSTFTVELNGTTPGTGYDSLSVTGSVTLGGATLSVSLGFTPVGGDAFTIIQNDGTLDPVSGTFGGLGEGAILTLGNDLLQISYVGGDGNDVVLTKVGCVSDVGAPAVTAPSAATVTQTLCM